MTTPPSIDEATVPGGDGSSLMEAGTDPLQLVTFEVGEEEFAIEILAVQEIVRMMPITEVPHSPASVQGVVNLRGQITPVLDLRQRFNLPSRAHHQDARIIVVEIDGGVLGFIVDRVNEVMQISPSVIEPAPALVTTLDSEYVRGVGKLEDRLLILLNLSRLFGGEALRDPENVSEGVTPAA